MKEEKNMNLTDTPEKILSAFKDVFTANGFPFTEKRDEKYLWIESYLQFADHNNLKVILEAAIDLNCAAIQLFLKYYQPLPEIKWRKLTN